MNIFVSGGAGYIGSTYVEQALNAGHAVTGIAGLDGRQVHLIPRQIGDFDLRGTNAQLNL